MKSALATWQFWAILSAAFAALTAIFAKVGIENVSSDFATFIRTIVILCTIGLILIATHEWQPLSSVSGRSYVFLVLSGLATGGLVALLFSGFEDRGRHQGGADRQAERRSRRCFRGRLPGRAALNAELAGHSLHRGGRGFGCLQRLRQAIA